MVIYLRGPRRAAYPKGIAVGDGDLYGSGRGERLIVRHSCERVYEPSSGTGLADENYTVIGIGSGKSAGRQFGKGTAAGMGGEHGHGS